MATRRKRQHKIKLANMWFFEMTLEERVKHQICSEKDCNESGIFSPNNYRNWYCGKHIEEQNERQIQSELL